MKLHFVVTCDARRYQCQRAKLELQVAAGGRCALPRVGTGKPCYVWAISRWNRYCMTRQSKHTWWELWRIPASERLFDLPCGACRRSGRTMLLVSVDAKIVDNPFRENWVNTAASSRKIFSKHCELLVFVRFSEPLNDILFISVECLCSHNE